MTLVVGDLHAMPANLEDTGLLLKFVSETCRNSDNVTRVIFLGDIFHTHAVVRQEAAHLVKKWIVEIAETGVEVYLMAGNHDGSSPDSVAKNAVRLVFEQMEDKKIFVVDDQKGVRIDNIFMLPFIGDLDSFVEAAQQHPDAVLLCHQTIEGAYYENRTLAPGGVKQALLPQKRVIAGHIHMEQTVGKVFYPGTPRALNANEYNEEKGIWIFDADMKMFMKVNTGHLVKEYHKYFLIQGGPALDLQAEQAKWKSKDDVTVVVSGDEQFYATALASLEWAGDRLKITPDIRKVLGKSLDVESDGATIESAFFQYVHEIYDANQEDRKMIWDKIQQIVPNLGSSN